MPTSHSYPGGHTVIILYIYIHLEITDQITFVNEGVAAASSLVMLLQQQNPLTRLGHDGPGGHGPDTRADDDGVKMLGNLDDDYIQAAKLYARIKEEDRKTTSL